MLNGATFYVDEVTVAGFGVGTDPWQPTAVNAPEVPGPVTVFEASNVQASAGTWSLLVTAEPGHGAFQQINGVQAGVTYTASVDVGFASAASTWALEVRDAQGTVVGQTSATIGTAAFTTLTVTFTLPDFIPGSQGSVFMRVINYDAGTESVFIDEGVWFQGQPPDTVGKILGDLYDDATVDHNQPSMPFPRLVWEDEANPGFPYLNLDFSDTLDSAGAAWADAAISIRLTMRMSYSQVMAEFARMGYEYRIVPDAVDGIWLWQVYNPGTMQTDYTAAQSPAIQGGSSDVNRVVARKAPSSTESLVEGLDRVTARDRDATLVTALGRIEGSILDRESPDLSAAQVRVSEQVATVLDQARSYSYTLAGTLQDEPLTAYQLGDLLNIVDPPEVPIVASRFVDVTASITPQVVRWDVQFGSASIINPDAAVADAVAGLLAKFEYPEVRPSVDTSEAPEPGGGGGVPRVVIAAAGASDMSKAKSDYLATGTDDGDTVATTIGDGALVGEVRFTEGQFNMAARVMVFPVDTYLTGAGREATFLDVTDIPTIDWTFASGGLRFLHIKETNS